MNLCSLPDCERPIKALGYCRLHYQRFKAHGDPRKTERIYGDDIGRFWSKVDKSGDCWIWTGSITPDGYGEFRINGRTVRAHVFAYELQFGPIPDGLVPDHTCHSSDLSCPGGPSCPHRACVRHLEAVTFAENIRRGRGGDNMSRKTHCPQGHPYDDENTCHRKGGGRACRACNRERSARDYRLKIEDGDRSDVEV